MEIIQTYLNQGAFLLEKHFLNNTFGAIYDSENILEYG
jgi:hypothetical protein